MVELTPHWPILPRFTVVFYFFQSKTIYCVSENEKCRETVFSLFIWGPRWNFFCLSAENLVTLSLPFNTNFIRTCMGSSSMVGNQTAVAGGWGVRNKRNRQGHCKTRSTHLLSK